MTKLSLVLAAYLRTRRAMRLSAAQLARQRARQWLQLQPSLQKTPALAPYAGRDLKDFPITEISEMRQDYGNWNSLGLNASDMHRMAEDNENGLPPASDDLTAGYSTGTTGQRGIFLASAAERADYIGQSLARLLPLKALLKTQRLALHLRSNSALYSDVSGKRIRFAHFPLGQPAEETLAGLQAFSPTILIAPPGRLLAMCEHASNGAPALPDLKYLFYGSEPMSEAESQHVQSVFGLRAAPIYQATEGFIGGACPHGRLHLNDHSLEIELEPVPGTRGYRPILTDLRRHSQPVVRLRGDDYIELSDENCPCGFAGRVILPVTGRVQNIWRFGDVVATPGEVIAAVESVIGGDQPWRASASSERVTLYFTPDTPAELAEKTCAHLQAKLAIPVPITPAHTLDPWTTPKRIKVKWRDG